MRGRIAIVVAVAWWAVAEAAPPVDGSSGLTKDEIFGVIGTHSREIQYCIEHWASQTTMQQGWKVLVGWDVDPAGDVHATRIVSSTTPEAEAERCLVAVVGKWKFPGGHQSAIVFPFVLKGTAQPALRRQDSRRAVEAFGAGRLHRALRLTYENAKRPGGLTDQEVMLAGAIETLLGHLDRADKVLDAITATALRAGTLNDRAEIARRRGDRKRELELVRAAEALAPKDCQIGNSLAMALLHTGTSPAEAIVSSQFRCPDTDPFRHVASAAALAQGQDPQAALRELSEAERLANRPHKRRELVELITGDPLFATLRDLPELRRMATRIWAELALTELADLRLAQRGLPPTTLELAEICADHPTCALGCAPFWEWLASGSTEDAPPACVDAADPEKRDAFVRAHLTRWASAERAPLAPPDRERLDCALGYLGLIKELPANCDRP
jgi:hypothetical protein